MTTYSSPHTKSGWDVAVGSTGAQESVNGTCVLSLWTLGASECVSGASDALRVIQGAE